MPEEEKPKRYKTKSIVYRTKLGSVIEDLINGVRDISVITTIDDTNSSCQSRKQKPALKTKRNYAICCRCITCNAMAPLAFLLVACGADSVGSVIAWSLVVFFWVISLAMSEIISVPCTENSGLASLGPLDRPRLFTSVMTSCPPFVVYPGIWSSLLLWARLNDLPLGAA